MDAPTILTERSDQILTITLNRPDRLNALTVPMADDLTRLLEEARADDSIRCVILTGAGRGFCSGADLTRRRDEEPSRAERIDEIRWFGRLSLALADLDKPLIGAINGVAAGAGFGVALACDIRFAATEARFGSIFVKRGLSPDTGTSYYLPRLVGLGRAFEAVYTGRLIDSAEAERIGLVNRVVSAEELPVVTRQLAEEIAAGPPIANALARRTIQQSLGNDLVGQLQLEARSVSFCAATDDFKEGVKAFLEKRAPRFQGT